MAGQALSKHNTGAKVAGGFFILFFLGGGFYGKLEISYVLITISYVHFLSISLLQLFCRDLFYEVPKYDSAFSPKFDPFGPFHVCQMFGERNV